MAIMFGNGIVQEYKGEHSYIMKTEVFTPTELTDETLPAEGVKKGGWEPIYTAPDGKRYKKINPKFYQANTTYDRDDASAKNLTKEEWNAAVTAKEKLFCTYDLKVTGSVIEISANSFPGTYYVVGDTYARSETSGDDEFFQFIIAKAKVTSENTITLEAEGDPSVFNMSLRVMRPADGKMMKLVKYNLDGEETNGAVAETVDVIHNHALVVDNMDDLNS